MTTNKTHIYFIPGLGASSKIYEFIKLPNAEFECHYLEWLLPLSNKESLQNYAQRMADLVTHKNVILVGVSFGGIMVQEMSKFLSVKKIILISSIKNLDEFPKRLKFLQKTKAYKLFPLKILNNLETFSEYAFGNYAIKRIELYKRYLSVRDENYLNWALYNVLNWDPTTTSKNILHIHGTSDKIFPIKNIKNCIPVKNGTHAMIIYKAKTISKIILENI
ncbi:alpha/beta hydrolase [Lutibacter sp.]|uniref:alpha/beta hydrolase n=1 Tax=Lutibacter sp. TaxID=1925666 RepID=UPI0025BACEE9|nr:alpha/beta hydrolase [Lutibacter sp.]MCF6181109.1 alpha/beta hydrolase [Lutibacter sp.]